MSDPQFDTSETETTTNADKTTTTKCRLVINVPKYDGGDATTYLRLGSTPEKEEMPEKAKTLYESLGEKIFLDDERDRGEKGADDSFYLKTDKGAVIKKGFHGLTKEERKKLTERLNDDAGWRDHSDGNRITTTYGDKVEVIRGNYKLLVLGRQDDSELGAYYDSSGGIVEQCDRPYAFSSTSWVKNYDGTWKVHEEREKGDEVTVFHGDVDEYYYGNSKSETVGTEEPLENQELVLGKDVNEPDTNRGTKRTDPVITEKTWAKSITATTGSAKKWIPSISETTYVTNDTSEKHAHIVNEKLVADISLDSKAVGLIAESTACGLKVDSYIGPVIETYVGLKLELELAAKIAITAGASLELKFGPSVSYDNLKLEASLEETELKGIKTKINTSETTLQAHNTALVDLTTKVANMKTDIAEVNTKVGQNHTDISGAYDMIALVVSIL